MGETINLMKSHWYKLKRSWGLWLHFLVPIGGVFLFLLCFSIYDQSIVMEQAVFIQCIGIVFPFVISVIVGLILEREESIGYYNLLSCECHKIKMLLSYILLLVGLGVVATGLTMMMFAIGHSFLSHINMPWVLFLKATGLMMLYQIPIYLFHIFLVLRFGKLTSIGIGVFGVLTAAIMTTGLGDIIWVYFPYTWGARAVVMEIIYGLSNPYRSSYLVGGGLLCILLSVWFCSWEGRRVYS